MQKHGGDIYTYMEQFGERPLDFSASLNPLGLPAEVRERLADTAGLEAYPDIACRELKKAVGAAENLPAEWLYFGNGAADLIDRICYAFSPDCALLPAPTFSEYERALKASGCSRIIFSPFRRENGFRMDPDFAQQIRQGTDIVFFCNPNNPTGCVEKPEHLLPVLRVCAEKGALMVLDECFNDFLDEPSQYTMKPWLREFPNLIILKAFTKIYAMAGLRLGYCICADPSVLAKLSQAGQPWNVSTIAQQAGLAALDAGGYRADTASLIRQERQYLREALQKLGLTVYGSMANFLFFYAGQADLEKKLLPEGILLRSCAGFYGLEPGFYRAAVRTHAENIRLIESLEKILSTR
ncbi:MAG TPA: aminotransferase class I/II-fold pyridoxal phosphate-dependent enzyme [Firmicutes bacterium]|nr:aminotransferase class I/II-fold pyridoxal phosphate-dependent enzyme [Bacillota bacterium]